MNIRYHLQKIFLVAVATIMVTSAMTCEKLVEDNIDSVGNTEAVIMDTGRYMINTTGNTRSQQVQELVEKLYGARDIQYREESFTAVLEPKDLKKVHNLIIYIMHMWKISVLCAAYKLFG